MNRIMIIQPFFLIKCLVSIILILNLQCLESVFHKLNVIV